MLLLAAVAILGGVVVVAMGRGGEMTMFRRDMPLMAVRFRSPAEVAAVRLPHAPIGYQTQATSEALMAAADLVAERDAEIAALRRELNRLVGGSADADNPATSPGLPDDSVQAGRQAAADADLAAKPPQHS